MTWRGLAGAALIASSAALAQPLALPPAAPGARLEQRLDAPLPLELPLVDSAGKAVHLGDAFHDRPVLLVLGYYRCPQLCGLLMHGLLEALQAAGLPRADYRIVRVSIDPDDTPAAAALQRQRDLDHAALLAGARPETTPLPLRVLTGSTPALQRLADSAGFRYQKIDAASNDPAAAYAHPAGVIVATPDGRISRYLGGIRFDPAELRLALVAAGDGRIGSLADRLMLLCAHVDPQLGRFSGAVLAATRALGLVLVGALGAWLWRRGRPGARR